VDATLWFSVLHRISHFLTTTTDFYELPLNYS